MPIGTKSIKRAANKSADLSLEKAESEVKVSETKAEAKPAAKKTVAVKKEAPANTTKAKQKEEAAKLAKDNGAGRIYLVGDELPIYLM